MKCTVLHSSNNRIRVHMAGRKMSRRQADLLYGYLNRLDFVEKADVYDRTGDAVILFTGDVKNVKSALAEFKYENVDLSTLPVNVRTRSINQEYADKLISKCLRRAFRQLYMPLWYTTARTAVKSIKYIAKGISCIAHGQIKVELLDACSIGASILTGDFSTAGSVMFLLEVGEMLEDWTHKRSVNDLAQSMSLNIDKVWLVTDDGDVLVSADSIKKGDKIRVHTSNVIPLDGEVCEGEAMVNQASLTGESVGVRKAPGSSVYAGTVVEEGECVFIAKNRIGQSRYDRITAMIEQSELNSESANRAMALADKLVPYSLLGTAVTYALTRNVARAISILMVDFSCALKLAMPLSFLSAISEAGRHHITVKGGNYLELMHNADTIVFDKTGTLTRACPTVAGVVTFNGKDENRCIKLAACMEEHFPHSMANAVVSYAEKNGITHDEMHSKVEYIVAHGIATTVQDKKAIIGSYHFVFEDEKVIIPEGEKEKFENLPEEYSHLYLAVDGVLEAVILISDPVRKEAKFVVDRLHKLGIKEIVMMTGDSEKTAKAIAKQAGVDRYKAEVLPEDKAAFVSRCKAEGKTVDMIGDGINDTPALSSADVGIAISDGASIAREISDVIISAGDLYELVVLKTLSDRLMERIRKNYAFIMTFNGTLIVLGAMGILPSATSALLHNASTVAISLKSMTKLLDEEEK